MFNNKAQFIVATTTVNTYGDPISTATTTRTVFCRVVSADEKEKTLADSRGENAELVVILPDKKIYNDERKITINGETYKVTDKKFSDTSKEIRLVVGKWETQ